MPALAIDLGPRIERQGYEEDFVYGWSEDEFPYDLNEHLAFDEGFDLETMLENTVWGLIGSLRFDRALGEGWGDFVMGSISPGKHLFPSTDLWHTIVPSISLSTPPLP